MMTRALAAIVGVLVLGCAVAVRPGLTPASRVAPPLSLTDQDGHAVSLADALATGPAVVVFYRGHW